MKKRAVWLVAIPILLVVVLLFWRAMRSPSRDVPPVPAPVAQGPGPAVADPSDWPSGDALRVSLAPDAGALTLTKALYRNGDAVLEQTWPDGTRERWWYAHDGRRVYIGRDGRRIAKAAGDAP